MSEVGTIAVQAPVLSEPGEPLRMQEITVAPPKAGEVRVKMTASGVCHSCLHAADGSHTGLPMPLVLGDEGSGVIESVGPGSGLRVGQPVLLSWAPGCGACRMCEKGIPGLCRSGSTFGVLGDGTTRFMAGDRPVYHYGPATYSPLTVVPERAAIPVDDSVDLELAAVVGCAVATGAGAVIKTAEVSPGDRVVVFGCGGVGLSAIMGASAAGAVEIVAVDRDSSKEAMARLLGATGFIQSSVEIGREVRDLLHGGADCAVVAVGDASVLNAAIESLDVRGLCVLLGNPPTDSPPAQFSPHWILTGERRIAGSVYGSSNPPVDFHTYISMWQRGMLPLEKLVTRRYHIAQSQAGFDDLIGGAAGRGLIVF